MSFPLFPEDVLFEQRLLSCGGFYNGRLDGQYGDRTKAAEDAAHNAYLSLQAQMGMADARSEKAIVTLLPAMQKLARLILVTGQKFKVSTGISCSLLSGTRTYFEQNRLYALRPKVTNAHGGMSNHNFGIAVDVGLFLNGKYMTGANRTEDKAYADFAALVKRDVHDIEWGGDWVSFKDAPHYQYKTGKTLDEVRKLFEAGASFT